MIEVPAHDTFGKSAKIAREKSSLLQIFVEYGFALAVGILLASDIYNVIKYGYLPQPFFYDVSDTFMDWFNPAYYAHNSGTYEEYGSIYPPLTFIVMRIFGLPHCYTVPYGLSTRNCDWLGMATIIASYFIDIILVFVILYKIDKRTAFPRAFSISAGMPILFGLERGNVITMCFACVMLAFGPLLRSARLRWFFAALAINFKIYLIGTVVALLLRRRWLWVEGALLMTVAVYLVTFGLLGDGTPVQIIHNIIGYNTVFVAANQVLNIWYSDTYQPLISLLHTQDFPLTQIVGSRLVGIGVVLAPAMVVVGLLSIMLAAAATWLRPEVVPTHRVIFLGLMMAVISSEASGYTVVIPIFFVFMEKWQGVGRISAIITAYILSLPHDIILSSIPPLVVYSYFANRVVEVNYGIGLGMFVRPGLVILLAVFLSWVTIVEVWKDVRMQGWKDRWRFRRDWPLLPGVLRPSPLHRAADADR
jgi:hypothetical protein